MGFTRYAWLVLAYNIAVIVLGAYVRATGSGAGCGSHWPLCNGEVIPQAPDLKMTIEFSHRLTSGLAGISVIALWIWSMRAYPKQHLARKAAAAALVFMIIEAALGAGLVLLKLVAADSSATRAVYLSFHLTNTLILLACLTLTAWWSREAGSPRVSLKSKSARMMIGGLIGTTLLAVTGAIAALGDTLFPAASLAAGFQQDLSPLAHFLIKLRVVHPALAVLIALHLLMTGPLLRHRFPGATNSRLAAQLTALVVCQIVAGGLNLVLLAPVWMQLVHLFIADLLWVTLVLCSAQVFHGEEA